MRAKIFDKGKKTQIVLEAENDEERKQINGVWALRDDVRLASVCRIKDPSPVGIFLSLEHTN